METTEDKYGEEIVKLYQDGWIGKEICKKFGEWLYDFIKSNLFGGE